MNPISITLTPREKQAMLIGAGAHKGQRYGAMPYIVHISAVNGVLREFGYTDEDVLCAAWLHDTLEDTALDPRVIEAQCGQRVLFLVRAVTNQPGQNRRERHAATYPIIRQYPEAVGLKLADRIANVRFSIKYGDRSKLAMYRKEQADFDRYLYRAGEHEAMWVELRKLLLRVPPHQVIRQEA